MDRISQIAIAEEAILFQSRKTILKRDKLAGNARSGSGTREAVLKREKLS
jgi:hypothetical protein